MSQRLRRTLHRIDGQGYKAYREIKGRFDFGSYQLLIDYVQGDPYARPSRARVRIGHDEAGFPAELYHGCSRAVGFTDFLTRAFYAQTAGLTRNGAGSGNSGKFEVARPGQEILKRSACLVDSGGIEVRFRVGLPAHGRRIAADQAQAMLITRLPRVVDAALRYASVDAAELKRHVQINEDADALRQQLGSRGLIAFIADGAILPRRSGIDDRPLLVRDTPHSVIPFKSPKAFRIDLTLPNAGTVSGMGVPEGVTLIVGGGYHGKSTLLKAIERGVYNHVPDDGREHVASIPEAVKIRAEDGRSVCGVNISPFITNLPLQAGTTRFSSANASGSTSQAAGIMEQLEVGAKVLLIDEDTSATNFMIRDHAMQQLIAKANEPITPFIDKVQQLYIQCGVSTVLVIGGSGDYFAVADQVIGMTDYRPEDMTARAQSIVKNSTAIRKPEGGDDFGRVSPRIPITIAGKTGRQMRPPRIKVPARDTILLDRARLDLSALEQVVDSAQTRAVARALPYAEQFLKHGRTLAEVVSLVTAQVVENGLDILDPLPNGNFAVFRRFELAAIINRLRTLRTILKE